MAARINPSKGGKPDKLIRDAIMVALKRDHVSADGKTTTKLKALVAKLVDQAADGSIFAIREIADRVDGRPTTTVETGDQLAEAIKGIRVIFGPQD